MHITDTYQIHDDDTLHALMVRYPLATVVTSGVNGTEINHVPLILHRGDDGGLRLQGHVARNNTLGTSGGEALAVFHGPNAYISPSWYPSKAETGRVVPTWNYLVVHARGRLQLIEDAHWLRQHLRHLTEQQEAGMPLPWTLEHAPADFIETMLQAVIGFELHITQLVGKAKASQNQSDANVRGLIIGLLGRDLDCDRSMAQWVALLNPSARHMCDADKP